MSNRKNLTRLVFSALFLALAMILPFFTGQIPEIGAMLCPMHIPVILCGFICSYKWGIAVGFTAPILRSIIMNGMPPMFPTAVCMAFELAVYGAVSGIMYRVLPKKKQYVYVSLVTAMLAGRIVWGIAMFFCMGISGGAFSFAAFMAGAFTNALPGIIVQIALIPIVVIMLQNTKIMKTDS